MEMCAFVAAVPVAFVAAGIYAALARPFLRRPLLGRIALWASVAVLVGLMAEWVALGAVGAVRLRAVVGPAFYAAHQAIFLLTIPSLANLLILKGGKTPLGSWFVVALLCSAVALPICLTQYGVIEALYGVDGAGGPYGSEPGWR